MIILLSSSIQKIQSVTWHKNHEWSSHICLIRCSDALQTQLIVVGSSRRMFSNLIQGRISLSLSSCLASLPKILQMTSRQFILFMAAGLTNFFFVSGCFFTQGSFFKSANFDISGFFTISGCFTISGFFTTSGGFIISDSLMGSFSTISVKTDALDTSIYSCSSSSTIMILHPTLSVFNFAKLASSLIYIFSSYLIKKNLTSLGKSLKVFLTFSRNMAYVLIDDTTIFLLTPLY